MKTKVCKSCGYVGKPIPQAKDSFMLDLFFWLIALALSGMSQQWYIMFLPLAWTIYHIARFNTVKCPKCGNLDMVSLNSHKGKEVLAHQEEMAHHH